MATTKTPKFPKYRDEWMATLSEAMASVMNAASTTQTAIGETIHAEQMAVGHAMDSEPTFEAREKSVQFAVAAQNLRGQVTRLAELADKYLQADRKGAGKPEAIDDI